MELITMFISHLFKSAEYFLIEGVPTIPLEQIIYVPEALFWQTAKIVEIYLSIL